MLSPLQEREGLCEIGTAVLFKVFDRLAWASS
jgi:hypothetical protein